MSIESSPLGEQPPPTSQAAREQLSLAARPPIISRRDLRLHAAASTVMGLCLGGFVVLFQEVRGESPWVTGLGLATCAVAGIVGALLRRLPSAPRNRGALDLAGFAFTLLVMWAGGLVLLSTEPGEAPLWLQCLVVVVVALPLTFVGWRILRSDGR